MKELELLVPTPDGDMPAFAAMPQDTTLAPGILIYMDVFGPREELRDIARRFASCGYLAVLPNLFHRLGSPVFTPMQCSGDTLPPAATRANQATTMQMTTDDSAAVMRFAKGGGFGIVPGLWGAIGYCMGGRHAIAAACVHPQQVRTALSVHGGRLVDESDNSPHRMIRRSSVPLHYLFAKDDPTCPPEHQLTIERLAARTNGRVTVEHVDAHHGWTFPTRWCHDHRAAERVWECALARFRRALWTVHQPRRR